jgi:transposase
MDISIDIESLVPKNDSVRLLSQVLEGLDYRVLNEAYSTRGRKPAVPPEILFKILIYAYMCNIYSSRKIERACRRDINFMWLLQGRKAPDHNTIARFRTGRVAGSIDDLFSQVLKKLAMMDSIEFKNAFIDGTKIEANANKYTFVWKKTTSKHQEKLYIKSLKIIEEINSNLSTDFILPQIKVETNYMTGILNFLNEERVKEGINFVSGKGKRKSPIQRYIEAVEDIIEKQTKYDEFNKTFGDRNSFSKTDKDATFMKMKDDHMKNAQLKPGYNIQIAVESEYIVGVDISSERSDQNTLIPFLKKLEENLQKKFSNIVADAGYESEENYVFLEENNQASFIKPTNYEITKKSNFKKNIGKRENMKYDEELDEYTCYNNQKLRPSGHKTKTSKSGYKSEISIYECDDCSGCTFKTKCTKAQGNRKIQVSKIFTQKRQQSLVNICSPEGIVLRVNRSIQVEGAFGVLKEDYGFRRFYTRGMENVKIEFMLLSLGFNVNKLHNRIQNDRCGAPLHEIKVSLG